jgi:hypothetical protein
MAASQPPPTNHEVLEANGGCYDAALVGRIIQRHEYHDLNDILPAYDESLWWGGISSVLVRRETQVVGKGPEFGWVKIIMSALPLRTSKVFFLTKAHGSGVPIVIYWTILRRGDAPELTRALADAPVGRCP